MRCLGPSNNKDTKDKSGKVENIPSTSLDEFGDDSTKMYGSDNSVLSRMVLPHMVAPEAYKPYVGGNSNRCGTCDYNYKV